MNQGPTISPYYRQFKKVLNDPKAVIQLLGHEEDIQNMMRQLLVDFEGQNDYFSLLWLEPVDAVMFLLGKAERNFEAMHLGMMNFFNDFTHEGFMNWPKSITHRETERILADVMETFGSAGAMLFDSRGSPLNPDDVGPLTGELNQFAAVVTTILDILKAYVLLVLVDQLLEDNPEPINEVTALAMLHGIFLQRRMLQWSRLVAWGRAPMLAQLQLLHPVEVYAPDDARIITRHALRPELEVGHDFLKLYATVDQYIITELEGVSRRSGLDRPALVASMQRKKHIKTKARTKIRKQRPAKKTSKPQKTASQPLAKSKRSRKGTVRH